MSRITKQIAELTAKSLVKSKKENLANKERDFKEKVEKLVLKQIPVEVLKFSEKYSNYTEKNERVEISGNGWNFQTVVLKRYLPSPNGNRIHFLPDVETAETLLQEYNEIRDYEKAVERLEQELISAIFNLRTYKSVEENFPEAFLLLPKIVNQSLQINLSDIRNRINN